MLALSRKKGEGIIIGDDIEIVIIDVTKEGVKLGINAPKNISIHRKEIYLQIQDENKKAMESSGETAELLKNMFTKKE
ncbi:carbon storage regulator CsrA [Vallitalea guaymasensis]|uniref:carbon storage regulator CsrA n=1 Tax=Vallitalea guaymasensis TaxID=1185412 RepID=UPI000DE3FAE5|nr:carbon storage regulator CsrA [Vallitalea guaymasensis]